MPRPALAAAACALALIPGLAAAADAESERIRCEGAAKDWAPVRLPAAGLTAALPCNDSELSAYKNANDERKRTEGVVGCERAGRTYLVMYLINTPAGFFDRFTSDSKGAPAQRFEVSGHRVFRTAGVKGGEAEGHQLIEIDASRSVLMASSSKVRGDAEFGTLTSCFFNAFQFPKP